MNELLPGFSITQKIPRALHHFVVWQKVAGAERPALPVLYVMSGPGGAPRPITALLDYCLAHPGLSATWLLYRCRAVGSLGDFLIQRRRHYEEEARSRPHRNLHRWIIRDYARAMIKGTISFGPDGMEDLTGLHWLPTGLDEAERRLQALRDVARWLDTEGYGDTLAKAVMPELPSDPSGAIDFLYVAQVTRRISLLDYLSPYRRSAAKSVRKALGRGASPGSKTFSFPLRHVIPLIDRGFRTRVGREDSTARLLAMLMLFGGMRGSEGLHLWVGDFQVVERKATLFLFHPSDSDVVDPSGETVNRRLHLEARYGLSPRSDSLRGRHASGWKGVKSDRDGALVYWLPVTGLPEAMAAAIQSYLANVRAPAMRLRRALGLPDHPFLLVSTGHAEGADAAKVGDPYAMSAFRSSWVRAVDRLRRETGDESLVVAKENGTTVHGSRHFYAKFLEKAGLDGAMLAECLHHMSAFSHLAYKTYSADEVSAALNTAASRETRPDWGDLDFPTTSEALRDHRDWRRGERR